MLNEPAVLECVEILPPYETSSSIGWSKVSNGNNAIMSGHAPGNNVLHIEQASEEDNGEYRCQLLTSRSGSEDADIRLVVISK